jgi:hypothetical protein
LVDSGFGEIGAAALPAAAAPAVGVVSETSFVATTGSGFAPAAGAITIACLATADSNASASGLMPAAGLISAAGFGTDVAGTAARLTDFLGVGGCGSVAGFDTAAGSAVSLGLSESVLGSAAAGFSLV